MSDPAPAETPAETPAEAPTEAQPQPHREEVELVRSTFQPRSYPIEQRPPRQLQEAPVVSRILAQGAQGLQDVVTGFH